MRYMVDKLISSSPSAFSSCSPLSLLLLSLPVSRKLESAVLHGLGVRVYAVFRIRQLICNVLDNGGLDPGVLNNGQGQVVAMYVVCSYPISSSHRVFSVMIGRPMRRLRPMVQVD